MTARSPWKTTKNNCESRQQILQYEHSLNNEVQVQLASNLQALPVDQVDLCREPCAPRRPCEKLGADAGPCQHQILHMHGLCTTLRKIKSVTSPSERLFVICHLKPPCTSLATMFTGLTVVWCSLPRTPCCHHTERYPAQAKTACVGNNLITKTMHKTKHSTSSRTRWLRPGSLPVFAQYATKSWGEPGNEAINWHYWYAHVIWGT